MLKSTYKPSTQPSSLPEGWSSYIAPSGLTYFYNDSTKESTYTRPTQPPQPTGQTIHDARSEAGNVANGYNFKYAYDVSRLTPNSGTFVDLQSAPSIQARGRGISSGGHGNYSRPQQKDRPKKSHPIPGCTPWHLVSTKLGRRFVYNPDSGESFWNFPSNVMKGVVEYDRLEREERLKKQRYLASGDEQAEQAVATAGERIPTASRAPAKVTKELEQKLVDSDGEDYEEVEVTDDEDEVQSTKLQQTGDPDVEQVVEFNEDDIAYQLAAMGEDYGLDPGEYGDGGDRDLEEGAQGLVLTEEDSKGLFKDLLNDYHVSPYTPWEKIVETGQIIEDDRYTVLPNMKSRKEVWDEWSRLRIQDLREQRQREEKKDLKVPYFAFLEKYATPKLYWPEFRRKYKKEPEMHNTKLNDKDRERWYREHISRLKLPEPTLKGDLVKLLKSIPLQALNRSTTIDTLPATVLTDARYISVRSAVRDPLIEAHITTLLPAPVDQEVSLEESEAWSKERHERDRRQRALADRQKQVENEKRRQQGALRYSKGMLREGEEQVRQAMRVGKEGLLGHMVIDE